MMLNLIGSLVSLNKTLLAHQSIDYFHDVFEASNPELKRHHILFVDIIHSDTFYSLVALLRKTTCSLELSRCLHILCDYSPPFLFSSDTEHSILSQEATSTPNFCSCLGRSADHHGDSFEVTGQPSHTADWWCEMTARGATGNSFKFTQKPVAWTPLRSLHG